MIIRVLSVQIEPDRGADFHAFIRERGLPRIQAHPGLCVGQRRASHRRPDEKAVVVTVWRDWESLTDALGPDPSQPYLTTPSTGLVKSARVEHFEAIDLPPAPTELSELSEPDAGPDAPGLLIAPSATA